VEQFINTIKQYWLIISAIILVLITILSLTPMPHLPSVPGSDKTHHFIAYAGLFFPVALAKPKHWLLIGLLFIFWSGAIELIQPSVNRYAEWLDLIANSIGVMCGFLLAWVINIITHKVKSTTKDKLNDKIAR
jgi:VanZ family protein